MTYLLFISVLLVRLIVQYYTGTFVYPEVWEYEAIVNNFIAGKGLALDLYGTTYYSLATPLYPLLCALVYSLTGHSFLAMAVVQAFISSFMCIVIFWIGRHIFSNGVGLLAALLTAFHPGIIIYTAKFHAFVLDSLLICLTVWLLIKLKESPTLLNQFKLGLSFGLAMLTRSTIILFLPFSWLWLKKRSKKLFFVYILISLILLSPWLIRNYLIYRKVLIVSTSANVFWRGNNPLATGTSLAASGKPMLEEAKDFYSSIYGKSEMEQNRIFWNESFKFIRNNPMKFVKLFFRKFFYFWWFAPTTGSEYKKEWLSIYKIFYSVILLFSLLGIFGIKKLSSLRRYDALIVILLMSVIAIAQSLFYVETRHRWAIEPLLLIFAAKGLVSIRDRVKCFGTKI